MTIVRGTADEIIPFAGGPSRRSPDAEWTSAYEDAAFWVDQNDLSPDPRRSTSHGGRVVRSAWGEGGMAPVVLYELHGWPHVWPGARLAGRQIDTMLDRFEISD